MSQVAGPFSHDKALLIFLRPTLKELIKCDLRSSSEGWGAGGGWEGGLLMLTLLVSLFGQIVKRAKINSHSARSFNTLR